MKRILLVLACVALFAVAFVGCEKPAAQPLSDDEIVATVNGIDITKTQVDEMIESMPPQVKMQMTSPQGKKNLVEKLVEVELVFAKAKAAGYLNKPEVQDKIKQVEKQVVYAEYLQDELENATKPDDAAAKKFYDENAQLFGEPQKVSASHIVFSVADDGANDAAQRAACEKALPEAQKEGADFDALIKKYSTGTNKGGDLGFFTSREMSPPIAQAVFTAKEGEVKGCIKSHAGYHILKKTGTQEGATKSFEDSKEQISQLLSRQGQQDAFDKIMGELKKDASIQYNDKALGIEEGATPPAIPGMPGMPGQ